jgi:hypothetical protein
MQLTPQSARGALDLTDVDPLTDLWTTEGVRRFLWDGKVIARTRTGVRGGTLLGERGP